MLAAVPKPRVRMIITALSAAVMLASCTTTTNGNGRAAPRSPIRSTPDFPSAPATSAGPGTSAAAPTTSADGSIHPAPDQPLRTVVVKAFDGVSYFVQIWADVKDDTCFDHAYGEPIVSFLTQHPCMGLERYLGTTTVNGRAVGFAESATGFRGTADDPYKYAREFSDLEREDGTGSINDLLREGYRLPSGPTSVPSPDAFNVLGQDEGVTVWDVWYLDGPTPPNAKRLIKMTQDIFLQF
jgi:hypothetical protein